MSLVYAADHLTDAVRSLATSEQPLPARLQTTWDEHVQLVWMKPCLTSELLREFWDLWRRYTAPSDDPRSTRLRALSEEEAGQAIQELVALWRRTMEVSARAANVKLATLADLA